MVRFTLDIPTHTTISSSCSAPNLRPGQLWVWNFSVNDGTWFFARVTTDSLERNAWFSDGHIILKRGDLFMFVSLNDPGLEETELPVFGNTSQIIYEPVRLWHVCLSKNNLFWIDRDWFEQAKLVADTT